MGGGLIMEQYVCIGCGATIQTEDPKGTGYTPQSALNKMLESEGPLYCQRCFRLRNYNELQPASLTNDDFLKMLSSIADEDALVVFVVDLFDFIRKYDFRIETFCGR